MQENKYIDADYQGFLHFLFEFLHAENREANVLLFSAQNTTYSLTTYSRCLEQRIGLF